MRLEPRQGWIAIAWLAACGTAPHERTGLPSVSDTASVVSASPVASSSGTASATADTAPACFVGSSTPLTEGRTIELSFPLAAPAVDEKATWSKRVLSAVSSRLALGEVSDDKHECFDTAFFESPASPSTSVRVRTPPASAPTGCDRKKHADLSLVFRGVADPSPAPANALKSEDEIYLLLDVRGGCAETTQKSFKLEKASEGDTETIAKRACGADCHRACGTVGVERWRIEHVAPGGCARPEKVFLEIWSRGDERVADLTLAIGECADRALLGEIAAKLTSALRPFAATSAPLHKTAWARKCGAP